MIERALVTVLVALAILAAAGAIARSLQHVFTRADCALSGTVLCDLDRHGALHP